jgi:CcmD family protein
MSPISSDFFSEIGKIYVVVAVISALFLGIAFFLFYLDKKITKLENQIKNHE